LNRYALWLSAQSKETASEVSKVVGDVVKHARTSAPITRGGAYRDSFNAYIQDDPIDGVEGYVVASRHEMVIEFGWTDLKGKWHPGQYILTNALKKQQTGGRRVSGPLTPKP